MKQYINSSVLFITGVVITYFLSDFYNDINDENRIDFSRQESITLRESMDRALVSDYERGFTFSSFMSSVPDMTIEKFRNFAILPGIPPVDINDNEPPEIRPGGYHFIQRVEHKDRQEFEKNVSTQFNSSIQITDFNGEVVENKSVYWCIYFHTINSRAIGRDITTEVSRNNSLNFLLQTGNVSISSPIFSSCLLYTSPSPRDGLLSRMPSSA